MGLKDSKLDQSNFKIIQKLTNRTDEWVNSKQISAYLTMFADDVIIIRSDGETKNGKEANINKQLLLNIEKRSKDADVLINGRKWEELIANFYTPQSKILTPDGRTIVGKEDVSTWYKETVQDRPYQITTRVEEVNGDGDWAYSRGTYKLSVEGSEKETGK